MARHADPANVPDSPEEFLDQFNTFSIYQILPQLIELWGLNVQTEVESRKNLEKVSGRTTIIRTKSWPLNMTWMSSNRKL